jgi:hypothetical protein
VSVVPQTLAGGGTPGTSTEAATHGDEENSRSSGSGNGVNVGAGPSGSAKKSGSGKRTADSDEEDDPDKPKKKINMDQGEIEDSDESEEEGDDDDVDDEGGAQNDRNKEVDEEPEEDSEEDSEVDGGDDVGSEGPSTAPGSPNRERASTASGADGSPAEGKKEWMSYKDLMDTTYPAKSRKIYLTAFVTLEKYLKRVGKFDPDNPPDELSLLNYFHHLRTKKGWQPSTLWSHFSRVNAVMKRSWGVNLTKYPRLSDLLKGYESGQRVKKSSVFTPQQDSLKLLLYTKNY